MFVLVIFYVFSVWTLYTPVYPIPSVVYIKPDLSCQKKKYRLLSLILRRKNSFFSTNFYRAFEASLIRA